VPRYAALPDLLSLAARRAALPGHPPRVHARAAQVFRAQRGGRAGDQDAKLAGQPGFSTTQFPSAAYATLKAGGSNFGPPVVAAPGTGPYDPNATRWGDYSFAVPDDTSDSAWLATEYVPPKSSQTTTRARNWGTRVFEVPLG
jgi:hypothetical protein